MTADIWHLFLQHGRLTIKEIRSLSGKSESYCRACVKRLEEKGDIFLAEASSGTYEYTDYQHDQMWNINRNPDQESGEKENERRQHTQNSSEQAHND